MHLGSSIPLTASALCYALGYTAGAVAFAVMARRRQIATSGVMALLASGLIGGLLGAHLGQWLSGAGAGKSILGGMAGGYLAVFLHKRFLGITRPTGDLFAVAVSAGEAVGRWGCYFGGCCYGRPSDVSWAIWQHGAHRHPTQIYLSISAAVILLILLRFERTHPPENALFYLQGILFCLSRFFIEFYRDVSPAAGGLSAAQWACIAGFAFFSIGFARLMRRREPLIVASPAG